MSPARSLEFATCPKSPFDHQSCGPRFLEFEDPSPVPRRPVPNPLGFEDLSPDPPDSWNSKTCPQSSRGIRRPVPRSSPIPPGIRRPVPRVSCPTILPRSSPVPRPSVLWPSTSRSTVRFEHAVEQFRCSTNREHKADLERASSSPGEDGALRQALPSIEFNPSEQIAGQLRLGLPVLPQARPSRVSRARGTL
jgi:hypothetical protein